MCQGGGSEIDPKVINNLYVDNIPALDPGDASNQEKAKLTFDNFNNQVDKDRLGVENDQLARDKEKHEEEIKDLKSNRFIKVRIVSLTFGYLFLYSIFAGVVVVLSGACKLHISDTILGIIVGSSLGNVIALPLTTINRFFTHIDKNNK